MDIGVGSILTKGLGGPACNLLIFGPLRLYINPLPTPPLTPTPPPVSGGIGGGGSTYIPPDDTWYPDPTPTPSEQLFEITFAIKFRGKDRKRTFVVDSFKKDAIIKRVGKINTLMLKFKVAWGKISNNRFTARWKK